MTALTSHGDKTKLNMIRSYVGTNQQNLISVEYQKDDKSFYVIYYA